MSLKIDVDKLPIEIVEKALNWYNDLLKQGNMVLIPKCQDGHAFVGGWMYDPAWRKPIIYCPKCGGGNLGDTAPHGVRANGEVYQSVVCAHPGCDFHDFVKLEDWGGEVIPHD